MKLTKNKPLYLLSALVLLILFILPIRHFILNVDATGDTYQIHLLEITSSGATDLSTLNSSTSHITVDTMSMKRFVALRDDLDGKYDAVYIGSGSYSKSGVQGKTHNTKSVMNDITALKAKEITDYFINKGLYVFFNKEPFVTQTAEQRGILYDTFNTYRSSNTKSNVIFMDSTELGTMITGFNNGTSPYLAGMKQRPQLDITNKAAITDYSSNPDHKYNPGDVLSFNFNISNVTNLQTRPILAKLYMGIDKAVKMTDEQLVATTTLTQGSNGQISYKLPKTYSGLLYWKLEIVDQLNPLEWKDFDTGTIRLSGKKTIVNILQVLPNTGNVSSLLNSTNMDQSFLDTDDYQLNITTKSMNDFNAYVTAHANSTPRYGLNGTYDMLIFGFRDVYNSNAPIDETATIAVKDFINRTKQSVLFTHDTVYRNTSTWVTQFKTITGQIEPETNLGLSAPNKSTRVKPVNDGLLTQYPFDLKKLYSTDEANNVKLNKVAITHDQYFTLDLTDPDVIPWYNIESESTSSDKRDIDDSWNHYYTYSKGNVTYSGSGHFFSAESNVTFPVWEQRLFVNTMYRAYTGANHAPDITVHTPLDNSVKPSYQDKLVLSYTVDDWDFKDKNLLTSFKFKQENTYLDDYKMDETAVVSGQTITQTFNNPFPNGGDFQIEITAKDKQGAIATKTIHVTVQKVNSNLTINRTISSDKIDRGMPVSINYTISPNQIPYHAVDPGEKGIESLIISNIQYSESFPPNLEISEPLPTGTVKSGTLNTGYTLTRSLSNITYRLSVTNGVKTYVPDANQSVSFDLSVVPQEKNVYLLDNSKLSFEDIHSVTGSTTTSPTLTPNPPFGIAGGYNVFILGDAEQNANVEGTMAVGGNLTFSGSHLYQENNTNTVDVLNVGGNLTLTSGSINGNAIVGGTSTVIEKNNGSGSDKKGVQGIVKKEPLIDFNAAGEYLRNQSDAIAALTANGIPDIKNSKITFTGTHPTLNIFNVAGSAINNAKSIKVDAPAESTVIINITGTEQVEMPKGDSLTGLERSNVLFNFNEVTDLILPGSKGSVLAPQADIHLTNSPVFGNLVGASLDSTNSSHFKWVPFTGTVQPVVTSPITRTPVIMKFPDVTFKAVVKVSGLSLNETTIRTGSTLTLFPTITPDDADDKTLHWSSSNTDIVSVDNNGRIAGLSEGVAVITITTKDGSEITATGTVKVVSPTLTILGSDHAIVGERVPLEALYVTAEETITGYAWSIKPDSNSAGAEITRNPEPSIGSTATLTATKSGTVTIIAKVLTDQSPNGALSREHTITITNPPQEIEIKGLASIDEGNTEPYTIKVISPLNSDASTYTWSIRESDKDFVTLTSGADSQSISLFGKKPTEIGHPIILTATTNGPNGVITATKEINVGLQLISLSLSAIDPLKVGASYDLITRGNLTATSVTGYNIPLDKLAGKLTWSSDNSGIATVNSSGVIVAQSKGRVKITVSYKDNPTIKASIIVSIDNGDRY
ncbi:MAG: DUF5057 domain-containing protein [Paenibacillus sp.]|nr:DUF5057 domain-containing protein [Paenibacillus sp.]